MRLENRHYIAAIPHFSPPGHPTCSRHGNKEYAPGNKATDPVNLQQLTQEAVQHHREGRQEEAERLYRQILAAAPSDFTAHYMLGAMRYSQGRADEALFHLGEALKVNSAAPAALILYGLLLQKNGRFDDALSAYDRALDVDAGLVEALVNRGNVLSDMGRYPEALVSYDKALKLRPGFVPTLYNRGNAYRGQGRVAEALADYESALGADPGHLDAWINRGSSLRDLGQHDAALASFDSALKRAPHNVSALYNRGTALQDLRRYSEALVAFDRVLLAKPGFASALNNRAVVLQQLGRPQEALQDFERALAAEPGSADVLSNQGNLLREMKRLDEALASLDKALAQRPWHGEALNNRGNVLRDLGRLEEALAVFERALTLKPQDPALLSNRALVLNQLQRPAEAVAGFDLALRFQPDNSTALYNRGLALLALRRSDEALANFDRALALVPRFADAHIGRGDALRDMAKYQEALTSYDWALTIDPGNAAALNNLGTALQSLRRFDDALQSYDRALLVDPNNLDALYNRGNLLWLTYQRFGEARADLERVARLRPAYDYLRGDLLHLKMQACDWQGIETEIAALDEGVRAGKPVARPFVYQAISSSPADLKAASEIYAAGRYPAAPLFAQAARSHDRLRIGYVSADFREQATAFLAAGLYECHDREKFHITAFDTGWNDASPMRARLESAFDGFIDMAAMTDHAAASRVAQEEIDILVNLNGYFGAQRMGIFAHRPAPLQVNYLGFPATLGAPYIDYILADRITIPDDERSFYTEKVVWLPDSYQVNDSKRAIAPIVPSRASLGLADDAFVFCNFNHPYKLTPAMFALWMEILKKTGNSLLWLLQSNTMVAANLRKEAERHGVAGARLVFAPAIAPAAHLARIARADLFLDSLPYNAHTTASDSLWAGVPLLTCRGTAFPGRVAASLLHAAGLPELVTESLEDYQALALALAQDRPRLKSLRDKLAGNRSGCTLFDTARFARGLEAAYLQMWDIYNEGGQAPRAFAVPQ